MRKISFGQNVGSYSFMPPSLPEKIVDFASGLPELNAAMRSQVTTAFVDTLAVIMAGWFEPVMRAVRNVYPAVVDPLSAKESDAPLDPEQAALVWGAAAHALDFDDVHMTSVTHPSAVLVPAIAAAAYGTGLSEERKAQAYLVGLATNVALGEALGFGHYAKGWHATSTIGPVAAAAAVAHLLELGERAFRSSLSIAVSQAAGTQLNFGSMAKPLHAGLAAAAGLRAARLAAAGLEASADAFGEKGFLDLYGGPVSGGRLDAIELAAAPESLSRKLYPCCYMAHRLIAAAFKLGERLDPALLADRRVTVEVRAPYGCTKALRIQVPRTGLEAKFSGRYAIAAALLDRAVGLATFETAAVGRADVLELLQRVSLVEDALEGPVPTGIDHGVVRIAVRRGNETLDADEVAHYPGSPFLPITAEGLNAKVEDCLAHHATQGGPRLAPIRLVEAAADFSGLAQR